MRIRLGALLIVASAALATAAHGASPQRGAVLVAMHCGGCHATLKQGASPFAAAPPFRELGQRYPVEDLQEALAEGIVTAHPAMPQFRFSPDDVNDIIAYLKTIQAPHAEPVPAGR